MTGKFSLSRKAVACTIAMLAYSDPAKADVYDALKTHLDECLPGQGFVPTPYGADERFAPKSIWFRVEAVKNPETAKTRKAWIRGSSGAAVYAPGIVPTLSDSVDLCVTQASKERKWALAAGVAGKLGDKDVAKADFNAEWAKGLDLQVDLGSTELEWVDYLDLKVAQEANAAVLAALNNVLKKQHKDMPDRRVVVAAIAVENAKVTVKTTGDTKFSVDAVIGTVLNKLGLSYDSKSNRFTTLSVPHRKYIAFVALKADASGTVSTATAGPDDAPDQWSSPEENRTARIELLLPPPPPR